MLLCRSIQARIFACVLFSLLYMISGAMLTTIGIISGLDKTTIMTGCNVWVGIFVVAGSVTMIVLSVFPRKDSSTYKKMFHVLAMLSISAVVLLLCFINLLVLLLSGYGDDLESSQDEEDDTDEFINYLFAHYLSILGTCIGLLASLLGFLFIICALVLPLRRGEYERHMQAKQLALERRPTPYHIPHAHLKFNQWFYLNEAEVDGEDENCNNAESGMMDSNASLHSAKELCITEEPPSDIDDSSVVFPTETGDSPAVMQLDSVLVTKL